MLRRHLKSDIENWIGNGRDALLITGARQIGKTYLIRECLRESGVHYVELNFIERPELRELFSNARSTDDIIMRLSLAAGEAIRKGETIIFLDEVQEYKDIVTQIKFLVEDGSCRYIMSGSLLGVELYDLRSAPVGYMSVLDMYPLDLKEFANAVGVRDDVIDTLRRCFIDETGVDDYIHGRMLDVFYLYLIVGGMPEAVDVYIRTNDLTRVADVHRKILRLYRQDFTKYENMYKLRLKEIYDSLPGQLNNPNKRFKINGIGAGLSYERVENDFLWLKDAGVALPVYNVTEPKSPLIISEKRNLFKLFMSDVGLLTSCYPDKVKLDILNKAPSINNGALFENAVAQELVSKGIQAYYFNSKKQGELDFVIELDGSVTPLEIKSGKDYKKHSALANVLSDANYNINKAYIFSDENVETIGERVYVPVYMIMFVENNKIENLIYRLDLEGLA